MLNAMVMQLSVSFSLAAILNWNFKLFNSDFRFQRSEALFDHQSSKYQRYIIIVVHLRDPRSPIRCESRGAQGAQAHPFLPQII